MPVIVSLETLRENLHADILRRGFSFKPLKQRLVGLGDRPVASRGDDELRLAIVAREPEDPGLPVAVTTLERFIEAKTWT